MGAMAAAGQGSVGGVRFESPRGREVRFARPTGMKVAWFTQGPDGQPTFSSVPLETPGRYNFGQGRSIASSSAASRVGQSLERSIRPWKSPSNAEDRGLLLGATKLRADRLHGRGLQADRRRELRGQGHLPARPAVPGHHRARAPRRSCRPGSNQASIRSPRRCMRGSILLVLRMGNVDQEAPNTPLLGAGANGPPNPMKAWGPQYMGPPGAMVPFAAVPPGMLGLDRHSAASLHDAAATCSRRSARIRTRAAGPMTPPPSATGLGGPGTLPNFGNAGSMPPPQLGPLFYAAAGQSRLEGSAADFFGRAGFESEHVERTRWSCRTSRLDAADAGRCKSDRLRGAGRRRPADAVGQRSGPRADRADADAAEPLNVFDEPEA